MIGIRLLIALLAGASAIQPAAAAPQAPDADLARPKIGLALSGGGARGMAHVGVLRWLEEHRIPVDFIAGASMGGLVGGMYATGMTPAEMSALVFRTDWERALDGLPPYPQLSFRRKEDQRDFATGIELGLRDGIRMPRGLNEGHAIGLMLDRVALPYDSIGSFDDLPVPFRTLATELVRGEIVVFDRGRLSEALRATMALPGIFTPLETDEGIYADGGLLNNIPTDIVRDMGADIVIAVNVGSPLLGRDELNGLLDILSQSVAVIGIQNDRRNLELADFVVTPELAGLSILDFSNPSAVMDSGYAGAETQGAGLLALALDEAGWEAHLEDRRSRLRVEVPVPLLIEVTGAEATAARGIARALQEHLGRPIDPETLERDLTRIVGDGRFATLGYRVTDDRQLGVTAREKSHGPPFVGIAFDVDAATNGLLDMSIGARLTAMDVGIAGAEWRTDLKGGIQDVAHTEYLSPLGGSPWFLALRTWWRASTDGIFEDGRRIAEFRTRQKGAGLDVGYVLNDYSELRAGYELRGASTSIATGDPLLPSGDGAFHSAYLRWVYDGYDRAVIPTRGLYARAGARWYSEEPGLVRDLTQVETELTAFVPVSEAASVFLRFFGGDTFRGEPLPIQQFTLGGTMRLTAWNRQEYRDSRYALVSVGYIRDLGGLPPFFGDRLYAAGFFEAGRLFSDLNPDSLLQDFALAFGTRSPLGAVWLGGAWGEGAEAKVFFRIGRLF